MALCRTKKKIDSLRVNNPTMLQMAMEKMAQNIDEDPPKFVPVPSWARNPLPGKANWIPIMIIPSKGKVRLVFDAAAKFEGKCLNDEFLPGPDCNNDLTGMEIMSALTVLTGKSDGKPAKF